MSQMGYDSTDFRCPSEVRFFRKQTYRYAVLNDDPGKEQTSLNKSERPPIEAASGIAQDDELAPTGNRAFFRAASR